MSSLLVVVGLTVVLLLTTGLAEENCESHYRALYNAYEAALQAANAAAEVTGRADDELTQDHNDAFDLRLRDADVLEEVARTSDDHHFQEHVGGGRMVRESLMILHHRAYKRRDMEHKLNVHHDRVAMHREHVRNATAKHRVRTVVRSAWASWLRWVQGHCLTLLDVVAVSLLVLLPLKMVHEMRMVDRRQRAGHAPRMPRHW